MIPRRSQSAGFILLGVLVFTALLATLVLAYSRSAVLVGDHLASTDQLNSSQVAVDSGLAYALQVMQVDGAVAADLVAADGKRFGVTLTDVSPDLQRVAISVGDGEVVMTAYSQTVPSEGDALPFLTPAAVQEVLDHGQLLRIQSNTTIEDQVVDGIILIKAGRMLTLRNVVLNGTVVSDNAFVSGPWTSSAHLMLSDSVTIRPGSGLGGVALLLPDGMISVTGNAVLQIQGAVVAADLRLNAESVRGFLGGPVLYGTSPGFSSVLSVLGVGRAPVALPEALTGGSRSIGQVAFLTPSITDAERTAIIGYDFGDA